MTGRDGPWLYVGTAKAATEEATLALARLGVVWVPGNLAPRGLDVRPGDVLVLLWRQNAEDRSARVLGAAEVAAPRRPWGETAWLDTVPPADPAFEASVRLGYGGPRNYRTMMRLDRWTEDPGEIRLRTGDALPHLAVGGWVSGLPPREILSKAHPGGLVAAPGAVRDDLLSRITVDPTVLGGKPTVRGLRIAVEHVLDWLANGASPEEVVASLPELEDADVRACLRYAERRLANERIEPPVAAR